MSKIKYLLKFGREAHVNEFAEGSLYCSNAETFWGIEENLKIKGQGDILEAGSRMFAQKMTMQAHGTNETTVFNMNANVLVHFEPAKKTPMFCVFAVYDDDCVVNESGLAFLFGCHCVTCLNFTSDHMDFRAQFFRNALKRIISPVSALNACSANIGAMTMRRMSFEP